jgi:glutamate-ammonia-ligase adenylyltransferase
MSAHPGETTVIAASGALGAVMEPFPDVFDAAASGDKLASLDAEVAARPELAHLRTYLATPATRSVIAAVLAGSPYLTGIIMRDAARLQRVLSAEPKAHLAVITDGLFEAAGDLAMTPAGLMGKLRAAKAEVALMTALADIGGVWPVMTVTAALTSLADSATAASTRYLFRQAAVRGDWLARDLERPEAGSGYFVLAMGKHGAGELNYSSDIDLIVFFERELCTVRPGLEPTGFYVRLTRELVRFLSERTSDGYVFRTDLRLRPDPGATQVAISTEAALGYYETVGQNWERAALIKARPVAGDIPAGESFLQELGPYIWRRYLDFAAIADIHAMKRQIHAHRGFATVAVAGHDIKVGRGGIREIEFFAQTQQLIAGGRQSDLRMRRTLDALDGLSARGWIGPTVAAELASAYRFLRGIEHRLQMIADEQTQRLPSEPIALEAFARFAGYPGVEAFSQALITQLGVVQNHYDRLFEAAPELTARASNMVFAGEADDPATIEALTRMGYANPAQVLATVRGWHHGRYAAIRSPASRERLTVVQPKLIEALAETIDPDLALANFDRFLSELPAGLQLFALLRSHPGLMRLIADIMGSAPRLARILSRRRRLFDAVVDPAAFALLPTIADHRRRLNEATAGVADIETFLDALRIVGSEQAFLIGVRVLAGTAPPVAAARAYSELADVLIGALHRRIEADLVVAHGTFPGGGSVIVALGKLGSLEMTASSDLDLIVVYDVPQEALTGNMTSSGAKPLSAAQYFGRLTQRLVAAFSAPTSEGVLYEVDLRLRPSGQKGPLATSLSSFSAYQTGEAWTWEHMALTRARVVSGPPDLTRRVEAAIVEVLCRPRDAGKTAADVRDMRQRIAAEKGTDDIWDLKQVRGGLVDIEFIAQHLQLVHAPAVPDVLDTNTAAALAKLARHDLLSPGDSEILTQAADLIGGLNALLRLLQDGPFKPDTAPRGLKECLARAGHAPSFKVLEAQLRDTQADVKTVFDRLISD